MSLPRLRFTLRRMMVAVAAVAVITFAASRERGPPEVVLRSARKEIPGVKIQQVRPEVFNGRRAWEVRGIDGKGMFWLIDVPGSGEVLMKEPIYDTVNKIPLGAVRPLEVPRWGSHRVAVGSLESPELSELLTRISTRAAARRYRVSGDPESRLSRWPAGGAADLGR